MTAGVTLVRYNIDKWQETIAQSHQWKVKKETRYRRSYKIAHGADDHFILKAVAASADATARLKCAF